MRHWASVTKEKNTRKNMSHSKSRKYIYIWLLEHGGSALSVTNDNFGLSARWRNICLPFEVWDQYSELNSQFSWPRGKPPSASGGLDIDLSGCECDWETYWWRSIFSLKCLYKLTRYSKSESLAFSPCSAWNEAVAALPVLLVAVLVDITSMPFVQNIATVGSLLAENLSLF